MKNLNWLKILLFAVSVGLAVYFYPKLPAEVPSHWNAQGEVDGHAPKFWGLFLIPIIMIVLSGIFALIPQIDPLKNNISQFRKHYDRFVIVLLIFLLFVQAQIIVVGLGHNDAPNKLLPIGLGMFFYFVGILCLHSKRNWFVGIRTPWTLSSDIVWEKTNTLGGNLFKISGILIFLSSWATSFSGFVLAAPLIVTALVSVVYSYVIFKKVGASNLSEDVK